MNRIIHTGCRLLNYRFLPIVVFIFSLVVAGSKSKAQSLPETKHSPVVIAHRGNHIRVPENTLAAFQQAIEVGTDYVEVDLRSTKDGHLVILHDSQVDRTTNGRGSVKEMIWEQVRKLIVNSADNHAYAIPEFWEVLALCKGKINIYLDFKDADVDQTFLEIKKAGMEKNVIVYLNKMEQYTDWQHTAPQIPLMTSLPEKLQNEKGLRQFLSETKVKLLDNIFDAVLVEMANSVGVAVWVDVQNPSEGPSSWQKALRSGANGLQTDHPEALVDYLIQNKRR